MNFEDKIISQANINSFLDLVDSSVNILVLSHENPDPDAYGSAGGIGQSLKLKGKNVLFANVSGITEDLCFIAGVRETVNQIPEAYSPDLVIIVDCGDFNRIGEEFRKKVQSYKNAKIINIDHHISNDSYGALNIIDTAASSTAEIILALIMQSGLPFDKQTAVALYSGILADSGSFRYSCVRPFTFQAALECVKHGAEPAEIAKLMFSNSSLARVKLHALAMQNMQLHCQGKLAFIVVEEKDYKLCNASSDDCDGLAEKGRDIQGVQVSVMFKHDRKLEEGQQKLIWKISMRSKTDLVDLSAIAQQFGGGGHKAAAAFRYRKDLTDLQKQIIEILEPVLKNLN